MIMSEAMQAITDLDLAPIKVKLMHASGEGWSAAKADMVETEYRRFLYLLKVFPDAPTAPGVTVDVFWHYHILDTVKYAADCAAAFGYFVHHNPNVGLDDSAEDLADRARAGAQKQALYAQVFADGAAYCMANAVKLETSAYCMEAGAVHALKGEATAYCMEAGAARALKGEAAAYCMEAGAARALKGEAAAYCMEAGAARALKGEAAAYCMEAGAARALKGEAAAYCMETGAARALKGEPAAYCMQPDAARALKAEPAAYCMQPDAAQALKGDPAAYCMADAIAPAREAGARREADAAVIA